MSGKPQPLNTLDKRMLTRIQKTPTKLATLKRAYAASGYEAINSSLAKLKRRNFIYYDTDAREWQANSLVR